MSGGARCPRCRRATPEAAAFCPGCGAALGSDLVVEVGGVADTAAAPLPGGGRRARRIGLGVAVALAVAIGASVIGGGGDDRSAPTTSAATSPSTTAAPTTTTAAEEPGPTTTLPPVSGPLAPPLLGQPTGLRLLLATNRGIQRLDLDAGTLAAVETRGPTQYADDLLAMRGGMAVLREGQLRFVPYDAPSEDRSAPSGQLLGVDGSGRALVLVWAQEERPYAAMVDEAGAELRRLGAIVSPWVYPPAFAGTTGDLILPAAGGVFAWREGAEPRPVAAGTVVDAAGPYVLVRRCWPDPACRLEVVDVATGAVRASVAAGNLGDNLRLSPDGTRIVRGLGFDPTAGPLDQSAGLMVQRLADGQVTTLPVDAVTSAGTLMLDPSMRGGVAWSPDGRWLFFVKTPTVLSAWRDGLAEPIDLTIPSVELRGPVAVQVDW